MKTLTINANSVSYSNKYGIILNERANKSRYVLTYNMQGIFLSSTDGIEDKQIGKVHTHDGIIVHYTIGDYTIKKLKTDIFKFFNPNI